jgi:hypothetical protein
MEVVAYSREHDDIRRERECAEPMVDRDGGDDFVGIALDDEPRASRELIGWHIDAIDCRGHGHQSINFALSCCADRNSAAEREPANPQSSARPTGLRPIHDRECIICLAETICIVSSAAPNTAEVEADRGCTNRIEGFREHVCDLIRHRAAMQRMRMADHGDVGFRAPFRHIEQSFQLTARSGNREWLACQCLAGAWSYVDHAIRVTNMRLHRTAAIRKRPDGVERRGPLTFCYCRASGATRYEFGRK